jgi:hypothetical protein
MMIFVNDGKTFFNNKHLSTKHFPTKHFLTNKTFFDEKHFLTKKKLFSQKKHFEFQTHRKNTHLLEGENPHTKIYLSVAFISVLKKELYLCFINKVQNGENIF